MTVNVIFVGAPGCGKGTQACELSNKYNLVHVSTGDLLRDTVKDKANPLSSKISSFIDAGKLVPDDIVIEMLREFLLPIIKGGRGFILDGFPRTVVQAEMLDALLNEFKISIKKVFYFDIEDDVLLERINGRLFHPASGRTYHTVFNPPKTPMTDDVTGEALIRRSDDNAETLKRRLATFHSCTTPLIEFYSKKNILHTLNAQAPMKTVTEDIFGALEKN